MDLRRCRPRLTLAGWDSPGDGVHGVGLEPGQTPIRAEPDSLAPKHSCGRGASGLHLHAADRIEGIPPASSQVVAVTIRPVQNGKKHQKDDVEVRSEEHTSELQ